MGVASVPTKGLDESTFGTKDFQSWESGKKKVIWIFGDSRMKIATVSENLVRKLGQS